MNFVLVLEESIDDGCGDSFTTEQLVFIESDSFEDINRQLETSATQAYENKQSEFTINANSKSIIVEVFNFMQMKDGGIKFQNNLLTLEEFLEERSLKL